MSDLRVSDAENLLGEWCRCRWCGSNEFTGPGDAPEHRVIVRHPPHTFQKDKADMSHRCYHSKCLVEWRKVNIDAHITN